MKRHYYLLIVLFGLLVNSCTNIESKIEEKIKTSMDDPSSFELISIKPLDTLLLADNELFLSRIKGYSLIGSKESKETAEMNDITGLIDLHKEELNNAKNYIIENPNENGAEIIAMNWIIDYRQKAIDSLQIEYNKALNKRVVFSKELLELNSDAFNILNECSGIKNFDLISYRVEYRGTNKFGALVKTDTNVLTYNNEVYTDIYNIDKAFKEDTKKLTE